MAKFYNAAILNVCGVYYMSSHFREVIIESDDNIMGPEGRFYPFSSTFSINSLVFYNRLAFHEERYTMLYPDFTISFKT